MDLVPAIDVHEARLGALTLRLTQARVPFAVEWVNDEQATVLAPLALAPMVRMLDRDLVTTGAAMSAITVARDELIGQVRQIRSDARSAAFS